MKLFWLFTAIISAKHGCEEKPLKSGKIELDCSKRGFSDFPEVTRSEATNVERLDLRGNNLTNIYREALRYFVNLKVLNVGQNQIDHVDQQSFEKTKKLTRLYLDENDLTRLPSKLFYQLKRLQKLDLSNNELLSLHKRQFRRSKKLKTLNLTGNKLSCLDENLLNSCRRLRELYLSENMISFFQPGIFDKLKKLKTLSVEKLPLYCDCQISYFINYLDSKRRSDGIAPYTKCSGGRLNDGDLSMHELIRDLEPSRLYCPTSYDVPEMRKCPDEPSCPAECSCKAATSDTIHMNCRDKRLQKVPKHGPENVVNLILEDNELTELRAREFTQYRRIQGLDLSKNKIETIDEKAFDGLVNLQKLYLYENQLTSIGPGTLNGLRGLQTIMMNSNKLKCLPADLLSDQRGSLIIALHNNELTTLPNGFLSSNKKIQTLMLFDNPWNCDCQLKWLADYFDSSKTRALRAKCAGPGNKAGTLLQNLNKSDLKCSRYEERAVSTCDVKCPRGCSCDARSGRVRCIGNNWSSVNFPFPSFMTSLDLSNNRLRDLPKSLSRYALKELILINNQLELSVDMFKEFKMLEILKLDGNTITSLPQFTFSGLANLKELSLRENNISCIANDTFTPFDMHKLTRLDLFHNNLQEIGDGTLQQLNTLKYFNIMNNPVNCNCLFQSTAKYMQSVQNQISLGIPKCNEPHYLNGFQILHIPLSDLKCAPGETDHVKCQTGSKCPRKCHCNEKTKVVDCSNLQLTSIELEMIPPDTKELLLKNNQIESLPELHKFKELELLDLSSNRIRGISPNTFSLPKLELLFLAGNRIGCLIENSFAGLPKLDMLTLNENRIKKIPESAFPAHVLNSITRISLSDNELDCDCKLEWLARWIQQEHTETGEATCASPSRLKGLTLLDRQIAPIMRQNCAGDKNDDQCNVCASNPCKNDGKCLNSSSSPFSFQCICPKGFKGNTCEQQAIADPCADSPCFNGICRSGLSDDEPHKYWCDCLTGFGGEHCEEKIDLCAAKSCPADSIGCVDSINAPQCICPEGKLLSLDGCKHEDMCISRRPCKNDGRCIPSLGGYECECPRGWTGKDCDRPQSPCQSTDGSPCFNGGVCQVTHSAPLFVCNCPSNFTGQYCELERRYEVYMNDGAQQIQRDERCRNGHSFDKKTDSCRCSNGFSGTQCESIETISLSEKRSYAKIILPSPSTSSTSVIKTRSAINITLSIRPERQNGIVMYLGDGVKNDFVAVEVISGMVRVRHADVALVIQKSVELDVEHRLEIVINRTAVKVKLNEFVVSASKSSATQIIDLLYAQNLFIGGLDSDLFAKARASGHIEIESGSFSGCVGKIKVNDKPMFFVGAENLKNVALGCTFRPSCINGASCEHGTCITSKNSRSCKCQTGWTGTLCSVKRVKTECEANCVNGKCITIRGEETCQCSNGYSGKECTIRNPCAGFDCGHGRCHISKRNKPVCRCQRNYSGERCELRENNCKLRKHFGSYTYSESNSKYCKIEGIERNWCEGRRIKHSRKQLCHAGYECVEQSEDRILTLSCNDGSTITKPVPFVKSCSCRRATRQSSFFLS